MDADLPRIETLAPSPSEVAIGGWRSVPVTQSSYMIVVSLNKAGAGHLDSTGGRSAAYAILELPPLAGLERLRSFADFPENWNGEGGMRPEEGVIDTATKVYGLLVQHKLPQVTLNSLGQPMFLFEGSRRGEIVVTSGETIDYYFDEDDAPCGDDVAFVGHLPHEVIQYIRS